MRGENIYDYGVEKIRDFPRARSLCWTCPAESNNFSTQICKGERSLDRNTKQDLPSEWIKSIWTVQEEEEERAEGGWGRKIQSWSRRRLRSWSGTPTVSFDNSYLFFVLLLMFLFLFLRDNYLSSLCCFWCCWCSCSCSCETPPVSFVVILCISSLLFVLLLLLNMVWLMLQKLKMLLTSLLLVFQFK